MTRLPGHKPFSNELPKLPKWLVALYCLAFLVYAAFVVLFGCALILGVWWLYGQVVT